MVGYEVIPELISRMECESLVQELEGMSCGRAGTRHLMSSAAVRDFARDKRLVSLASKALESPGAIPFRATLFKKTAKANWLSSWHQDTALPLSDRFDDPEWGPWSQKGGRWYAHAPEWALKQVVALRVHLDSSTRENGPLRVIPGSHHKLMTDEEVETYVAWQAAGAVECLSPRGGIIVMRPLLIHASSKVENDLPRRVLHIEYAKTLALRQGIDLAIA